MNRIWVILLCAGLASAHSLEEWRTDLKYLRAEMPRRHVNLFHSMPRDAWDRTFDSLEERAETMTRPQLAIELMRLLALVGDGHTRLAPRDPYRELGYKR